MWPCLGSIKRASNHYHALCARSPPRYALIAPGIESFSLGSITPLLSSYSVCLLRLGADSATLSTVSWCAPVSLEGKVGVGPFKCQLVCVFEKSMSGYIMCWMQAWNCSPWETLTSRASSLPLCFLPSLSFSLLLPLPLSLSDSLPRFLFFYCQETTAAVISVSNFDMLLTVWKFKYNLRENWLCCKENSTTQYIDF